MNRLSHLPEKKQEKVLTKVPFELQSNVLPVHVVASIERGVKQASQGSTIGFEAFKKNHYMR